MKVGTNGGKAIPPPTDDLLSIVPVILSLLNFLRIWYDKVLGSSGTSTPLYTSNVSIVPVQFPPVVAPVLTDPPSVNHCKLPLVNFVNAVAVSNKIL